MYGTRQEALDVFDISFYNSLLQIDTYFSHLLPSSELNLFHEVFTVRSSTRGLRTSVANTLRRFPTLHILQDNWTCGAGGGGKLFATSTPNGRKPSALR